MIAEDNFIAGTLKIIVSIHSLARTQIIHNTNFELMGP